MNEDVKQLIEDNHNLIHFFMHKWNLSFDAIEDWYGVLAIGLCKAAATFNASKGYAFSTYASKCMYNSVLMSKRSSSYAVQTYISIDDFIEGYDQQITIQDTLLDTSNIGPDYIELYDILIKVFNQLSDRHQHIIYEHFLYNIPQRILSTKYHLAQSSISRIISKFKGTIQQIYYDEEVDK